MKVEPKTEEEISAANLLPIGSYDFEVVKAEEGHSKAGNEMVSLTVRVYDKEGVGRSVFDWLVSTDGGAYKVRHFAESVGMLKQYETGELRAEDMFGLTGKCKVVVKKSEGYPDKNGIADYLKPTNGVAKPVPATAANFNRADLDDEIPF